MLPVASRPRSQPLVLAGVHGGDALQATLAYRLASYRLPLCAGPGAYLLYRHRYGRWHTTPGNDNTHNGAGRTAQQ